MRLVCRTQHRALATVSPHSAPVTAIMIDTPLDVKVGHHHVIITIIIIIIFRVGWSDSTCSLPPGKYWPLICYYLLLIT